MNSPSTDPSDAASFAPPPTPAAPGVIPVVAAVIQRGGAYLVGRRPPHKRHGGLWEFPGGKLGDGEDLFAAAARELDEELGMEALRAGPTLYQRRDPGAPFLIHFLEVEARGEPVPTEHTEVRWCTPAELAALPLAPSDADFASWLAGGPTGGAGGHDEGV